MDNSVMSGSRTRVRAKTNGDHENKIGGVSKQSEVNLKFGQKSK